MSDFSINSIKSVETQNFNTDNLVDLNSVNLLKATSLIDFYNRNLSYDNSLAVSVFTAEELEILQNLRPAAIQSDFNKNDKIFGELSPDVQNNQVFKVTSNPVKAIQDKEFLQNLTSEVRNKVIERKLLSLKDSDDKALSYDIIQMLAGLADEQWNNISKRNIFSSLKTANHEPFTIFDFVAFSEITDEQWNNVQNRKLLTLKNANNKSFESWDIKNLSGLTDEQWDKVSERKLLTLKDANNWALTGCDIRSLAELTDEQWGKVSERKLLTLKGADNKGFNAWDISKLAKLSEEQWNKVSERKLLTLKDADSNALKGWDISEFAKMTDEQWNNVLKRKLLQYKYADNIYRAGNITGLSGLNDEQWKNVTNRNLISLISEYNKNNKTIDINALSKLTDKQWHNVTARNILSLDDIKDQNLNDTIVDVVTRLSALSDEEWNNSDKKTAMLNELIELTKGSHYSILHKLRGEEFEKTNELIYGKKSPEVTKLIDDFKKSYPDVELLLNNNVSEEKTKEIIDVVKEFVNNHKNSGLPYTKQFAFINMNKVDGFYNATSSQTNNMQHINMQSDKNTMRSSIVHENGHYRDFIDYCYNNKEIPEDIKPILKKILWDYSLTNNIETIAVLTQAIETPDNVDKDANPLTDILHVRKDENNNYYLMLPKNCNVSKEELEKLGEFLRDIRCPEIIPDFDANQHGEIAEYNQTLIREQQNSETIATYIAKFISRHDEVDIATVAKRIKE
ncbi:MAG: hypothetical protein MJ180_04605, partial [Candidatus Gastranaerophilales bacterium]|nr:hypothetical protein [Candidatus Gastranaerophilales bacterium]